MEEKVDKDFYFSLTKKKLQGLCKRYGLSSYTTKIHLANSLCSFFEKKNLKSVSPIESSKVESVAGVPMKMIGVSKDSHVKISCAEEKNNKVNDPRAVDCNDVHSLIGAANCQKEPCFKSIKASRSAIKCRDNSLQCGAGSKSVMYDKDNISSKIEAVDSIATRLRSRNLVSDSALAGNASTESLASQSAPGCSGNYLQGGVESASVTYDKDNMLSKIEAMDSIATRVRSRNLNSDSALAGSASTESLASQSAPGCSHNYLQCGVGSADVIYDKDNILSNIQAVDSISTRLRSRNLSSDSSLAGNVSTESLAKHSALGCKGNYFQCGVGSASVVDDKDKISSKIEAVDSVATRLRSRNLISDSALAGNASTKSLAMQSSLGCRGNSLQCGVGSASITNDRDTISSKIEAMDSIATRLRSKSLISDSALARNASTKSLASQSALGCKGSSLLRGVGSASIIYDKKNISSKIEALDSIATQLRSRNLSSDFALAGNASTECLVSQSALGCRGNSSQCGVGLESVMYDKENMPSKIEAVDIIATRLHSRNLISDFAPAGNASTHLEKSAKHVSSFEFHVSSGSGINIIVDLDASPSELRKGLENEVSSCYCAQSSRFRSLREELKLLGNSSNQVHFSDVAYQQEKTSFFPSRKSMPSDVDPMIKFEKGEEESAVSKAGLLAEELEAVTDVGGAETFTKCYPNKSFKERVALTSGVKRKFQSSEHNQTLLRRSPRLTKRFLHRRSMRLVCPQEF